MVTTSVERGLNIWKRGPHEDEAHFLQRLAFYSRCTQWLNDFERALIAKSVPNCTGFSVQFSRNLSCATAEFRWYNKQFCVLFFDPVTGCMEAAYTGVARQRFLRLMSSPEWSGVELLSGFLIEVVKNEITHYESLRDALSTQILSL